MNMCVAKACVLLAAVACSIIACSSQDNGGERASSDDGDAAVDGSPSSDDDPQQASASNQRTQLSANGSRSARPNVDRAGRDDERTTHAPIVLAYPAATIYRLDDRGIDQISYEQAEHVTLTRDFLNHREQYLAKLMEGL